MEGSSNFSPSSSESDDENGVNSVEKEIKKVEIEDFAFENKLPISHQVDLVGHSKSIPCISCEPAVSSSNIYLLIVNVNDYL
jgi:hypothetical protein